ncbi:MAG: hypothetical protein AAF196_19365 [Planctomycetota bacterium]
MFPSSLNRFDSRLSRLPFWTLLPVALLFGCGAKDGPDTETSGNTTIGNPAGGTDGNVANESESRPSVDGFLDAELEPWRRELLVEAFENASKFPLRPHLKNRSKAQQEFVIATCIELGQLGLAIELANDVDNWRRGLAVAEVLERAVRDGSRDGVDPWIDQATEIAYGVTLDENEQPWRRDRIRTKLAESCILLGRIEQATELEAGIVPSERGKSDIALSRIATLEEVELLLDQLDGVLELRDFDRTLNSLPSICVLYERFFDKKDVRRRIGSQVRGWIESKNHPAQASLDAAVQLARVAADRGSNDLASSWLDLAQQVFDSVPWNLHFGLTQQSKISEERFRIGESDLARQHMDPAIERFNQLIESITDMERCEPLCAAAQAFAVGGELAMARTLYRSALEQAFVNQNARPRLFDLLRVALSWARVGFDPDQELRENLTAKFASLGDPW